MIELTPELIFTISSRIVEASTAGKDTAPGYRHGFIQGFAEAIEFIKTLDKRTDLGKRVRQNLCENSGTCDPNFAVNTPNCNDNGFAGEVIDCGDPGFYQGTGRQER